MLAFRNKPANQLILANRAKLGSPASQKGQMYGFRLRFGCKTSEALKTTFCAAGQSTTSMTSHEHSGREQ